MFCRFCGKAIPDDSCFCPVCGQALCTEEAAPHAQAEAPHEEATRQWYYQTATEKGGPVTRTVIEEYIQSGRIGARSMVFADGMTSWREAAYTELAPLFGLEAPQKPQADAAAAETGTTNGSAIASLVLGILSFFFATLILGVLALIFGGVGLSESKKGTNGRGLALAGMICGGIALVGWLILLLSAPSYYW